MNPIILRGAFVSLSLCLIASPPAAVAQTTEILERGPHHQIVQTITPDGATNTFVELRTGLGRWSDADGGGWAPGNWMKNGCVWSAGARCSRALRRRKAPAA